MAKKGKQVSRKKKTQLPEEDEKQNEMILEEVLSISGKNVEKTDGSPPPARLKRSASKSNETTSQPKKPKTKKKSVSPPSTPSKQKKSDKEEETNASVNEVKSATSERGVPVPNLPDGWRRQVVVRKSGKSAGQIDIYFYSPEGIKLRSRPDVGSYLKKHKSNLKIEEFDFSRTAKTNESAVKNKAPAENSTTPKKKAKTLQEEKSKVGVESTASENSTVPKKKVKTLQEDKSKFGLELTSAENCKVPKKKAKTLQEEKSKVGVESKESSKNVASKVVAEISPPPDTEEKNDATGKPNKTHPDHKDNTVEMNGKQKEKKNSGAPIRKKKPEMPEENEKKNEVTSEVSTKKVEKEDGSSTKVKRSAKKLDDQQDSADKDVEASDVKLKGDPVPNFPDGWRRQIVMRKSSFSAGKIDVYFYSPEGIKLRSRPDVASYLKSHNVDLKIEDFDFSRTAKPTESAVKNKAPAENCTVPKKRKTVQEEKSKDAEDLKVVTENLPNEVPQPAESEANNDAGEKSNKILRHILESKPKKSRR